MRDLVSPHSSQHLIVSVSLSLAILIGVECSLIVVLIRISLRASDMEDLSVCLCVSGV